MDAPLINGYYLDGNHDGGVYNSFNLAAYAYCRQNPIIYVDPDGNQFEVTQDGFWKISSFNKASYGSSFGWNTLAFIQNTSANMGNIGVSALNTVGYYGQSIGKGQAGNIVTNEVNGIKSFGRGVGSFFSSFGRPIGQQMDAAKSLYSNPAYWESIAGDAILMFLGGLVSGSGQGLSIKGGTAESWIAPRVSEIAENRGIMSGAGQTSLRNMNTVDDILTDMFRADKSGSTLLIEPIGGYKSGGKFFITEGHHRMNAALRYQAETGNSKYVNQLLDAGSWREGTPSSFNIRVLPTTMTY